MAYPSITYNFANDTTADASQVLQNFNDLIAGASDGTKSYNIDALTLAGALTANGAVTLGNASSDDITVNGYLVGALIPKTDDTYDLGTSSLAWQDAYLDGALYTDTISELTSAHGVIIDSVTCKDGVVTGSGLNLGNETMTTYDEGSFVVTWDVGSFTSGAETSTISYVKVGKNVTLSFAGWLRAGATDASDTRIATGADIPSALRPAVNVSSGIALYVASNLLAGFIEIDTSGEIILRKYDRSVFNTTGCGTVGSTISYFGT